MGGGRWEEAGGRWVGTGGRWMGAGGRWVGNDRRKYGKEDGKEKERGKERVKSHDCSIHPPTAALPISCARSATGRRKTATNL